MNAPRKNLADSRDRHCAGANENARISAHVSTPAAPLVRPLPADTILDDISGNHHRGSLGLLKIPLKAIDMLQPAYGLAVFASLSTFLFTGQFSVILPEPGIIATKSLLA